MDIENWPEKLKGLLVLIEVLVFLGMYLFTYLTWEVYKTYGKQKKDLRIFIITSVALILVALGLVSTIFKTY